jgi:hypothetical protein
MKLPDNPTPEQIKQVMNLVIKSIYTRGTVAVQTIERDSQGRLSGIFLGDGVRFNYTVADGALSYAPVNPKDLPDEDGADFMEDALDFARLKLAGNTKQVKACKKGYACGYTCISQNRNCRKPLPGQAKTAAEWVASQETRQPEKNKDKPQKTVVTGRQYTEKFISMWNESHGSEWDSNAGGFLKAKLWDKKEGEFRVYFGNVKDPLIIRQSASGEYTVDKIPYKYKIDEKINPILERLNSRFIGKGQESVLIQEDEDGVVGPAGRHERGVYIVRQWREE